MRRMSPAPRKNPAAFEKVGEDAIAVAAKAPSIPRRVMLVELPFFILNCPVSACLMMLHENFYLIRTICMP